MIGMNRFEKKMKTNIKGLKRWRCEYNKIEKLDEICHSNQMDGIDLNDMKPINAYKCKPIWNVSYMICKIKAIVN